MRWRAWYTEGRTYEGDDLDAWKALPAEGALAVVVYDDAGRTIYTGGDWYLWRDGGIAYVGAYPWGSHAPHPGGCLDCVKRGDGVSDEAWERVRLEVYRGR